MTDEAEAYAVELGALCRELERVLSTAQEAKRARLAAEMEAKEADRFADELKAQIAALMREQGVVSEVVKHGNMRWAVTLPTGDSERLVIEDERSIPAQFWEPTFKLDKQAVKRSLVEGVEIPGARLERSSLGPRIKPL